jgi:hypothetical protein
MMIPWYQWLVSTDGRLRWSILPRVEPHRYGERVAFVAISFAFAFVCEGGIVAFTCLLMSCCLRTYLLIAVGMFTVWVCHVLRYQWFTVCTFDCPLRWVICCCLMIADGLDLI